MRNVYKPSFLISYCLLNYRNHFLSILIINSDVLIRHSSNVFDYNPQWKEELSLLPVLVLGETTHRERLWSGSWKMKRTLLDEWGDSYFPGGGSMDKDLAVRYICSGYWEFAEFLWAQRTEKEGGTGGNVSWNQKEPMAC